MRWLASFHNTVIILQNSERICLQTVRFYEILHIAEPFSHFRTGFMLAEQRRNTLLELVRVRRFASLPELAEQLAVSESTVRRDLDQLEEQGVARRLHGGVLYTGVSPKLPHFDAQQPTDWEKKHVIAMAATRLIDDGDTILLDGGSTTYELARLLVGRPLARCYDLAAGGQSVRLGRQQRSGVDRRQHLPANRRRPRPLHRSNVVDGSGAEDDL